MIFVTLIRNVFIPLVSLAVLTSSIYASEKAGLAGLHKNPTLSLADLRATLNNFKASRKTCDLDFLDMLSETIANYVNRQELTEKEGVSMLVKMSRHENACKSVKY